MSSSAVPSKEMPIYFMDSPQENKSLEFDRIRMFKLRRVFQWTAEIHVT